VKCQSGSCIGYQSLDQHKNGRHCCTPSHGQDNGIHGTREGPSPLAPLEKRVWKRGGLPFPRHTRHSRNQHLFFIELKKIPKDRQIPYEKIVCDYKPHKKGEKRFRLTVDRDRLDYSGEVATSTADITTFKILINSTLSTKDAEMMMRDINNYYLGTPLPRYECIHAHVIFKISIGHCQQVQLERISCGWMGLHRNQKGNVWLETSKLIGQSTSTKALGIFWILLWVQKTRPIAFSLIVDNFTVKYVGKQHAEHLRNALLRIYELNTDWEVKVYSVITLQWDYKNSTCDISMPVCAVNVLNKFQHDKPKHPQDIPSRYVMPVYGAKPRYATQDEIPPLTAKQYLNIQKVKGSVLYYARAVDPTVIMQLNDIVTEQIKAT
jgi:hypothetical protein